MKQLRLGTTDLDVSRICFGTWQLSPRFWGEIPLAEWRAALHGAVDAGINFIDTADAYGNGLAEEELGKELSCGGLRERVVIATKFFWNFEGRDFTFPDTRRSHLLRACEDSLRRLRTDRIDLYQIHSWDPLIRMDEVAEGFDQLRREGKVRWFGVSNWSAEQMSLGRRHFPLATLQPKYNLLDRTAESALLPFCLEHHIGTLVYSPLERGLLGGRYAPGQEFSDARAHNPLFKGRVFRALLKGVDGLRSLAAECGLTVAQFTVRWVLSHPAVTCAILGVKSASHLEVTAAADATLPQDVWHRAAEIMAAAKAAGD